MHKSFNQTSGRLQHFFLCYFSDFTISEISFASHIEDAPLFLIQEGFNHSYQIIFMDKLHSGIETCHTNHYGWLEHEDGHRTSCVWSDYRTAAQDGDSDITLRLTKVTDDLFSLSFIPRVLET